MPVTVTLLDYNYFCPWNVRNLSLGKEKGTRRKEVNVRSCEYLG
jgi:hypothetical protein